MLKTVSHTFALKFLFWIKIDFILLLIILTYKNDFWKKLVKEFIATIRLPKFLYSTFGTHLARMPRLYKIRSVRSVWLIKHPQAHYRCECEFCSSRTICFLKNCKTRYKFLWKFVKIIIRYFCFSFVEDFCGIDLVNFFRRKKADATPNTKVSQPTSKPLRRFWMAILIVLL